MTPSETYYIAITAFLVSMISYVAWIAVSSLRATLKSVQTLLDTTSKMLAERGNKIDAILDNITAATANVAGTAANTQSTTGRVDDTLKTVLSIPNFIENIGKEFLGSLFRRGKREGKG